MERCTEAEIIRLGRKYDGLTFFSIIWWYQWYICITESHGDLSLFTQHNERGIPTYYTGQKGKKQTQPTKQQQQQQTTTTTHAKTRWTFGYYNCVCTFFLIMHKVFHDKRYISGEREIERSRDLNNFIVGTWRYCLSCIYYGIFRKHFFDIVWHFPFFSQAAYHPSTRNVSEIWPLVTMYMLAICK